LKYYNASKELKDPVMNHKEDINCQIVCLIVTHKCPLYYIAVAFQSNSTKEFCYYMTENLLPFFPYIIIRPNTDLNILFKPILIFNRCGDGMNVWDLQEVIRPQGFSPPRWINAVIMGVGFSKPSFLFLLPAAHEFFHPLMTQ
jgi:hypothetical protein